MKRAVEKTAQFHNKIKRKRDDRGSAIVIVIIAMAMIGIMATTMLWMAYMNYMIKVSDIRNKNSFYSAEEVVEQVMSGLRAESAEAVGIAYREVLANWDNLESEANRSNIFTTTYLDTLYEKLVDPDTTQHDPLDPTVRYYDKAKLKGYIDAAIFTAAVDEAAWDNGAKVGDPLGKPRIEIVNNNSIILKNIYVSCTESDGRLSIVQTDICLDVPKLVFENGGSIDSLYQYTLIGNGGVEMQGPGILSAEGSIYAGTDKDGNGGLTLGLKTEADGNTTKVGNTKLVLEDALRVISKGDITVQGPASSLMVRDVSDQDNRVYARNINLSSAAASLDSKVYVANDLTLDGAGSKVALTKEYYGYGNATDNGVPNGDGTLGPMGDPAASSAIIINGKDSTVDMSAVTKLLIAGRSYISPHIGNAGGQTGSDKNPLEVLSPSAPVMMGESIAVKGGQVAYLVPAECIGTLEGESVIGQNPINADKESDEMEEFRNAYGKDENGEYIFKEVDFDKPVYRLGGKTLRDMGVGSSVQGHTAADDMKYIRKVYAPYRGGTLLYYYLVMDQDSAARYFVQYYDFHANREEIDTYFNRYLSGGFQLGDFTDPKNQYTILGNSLVSSALTDSGVTLLTGVDQSSLNPPTSGEGGTDPAPVDPNDYTETGENAEKVDNSIVDLADVLTLTADIKREYKSLTFDLTDQNAAIPSNVDPDSPQPADPNHPQPGEYDKNEAAECLFRNIIKADAVKDYLDNERHMSHVTYTTDTPSNLQAYLTKGDVKVSDLSDKTRLIVSLGDVTVDRDFTGLIVAKGKITVSGGASNIKLGGTDLYDVLHANSQFYNAGDPADPASDNHKIIDWFVNGGSMANGAQAPDVDDVGNLVIDYGELVRYMNWIKK